MAWYKKIIVNNIREITFSVVLTIIFALTTSLWYYFSGKRFEWQSISPIEAPGLLPRLFYSALVYITLGAFLYALGFYKALYSLFRGTHGGFKAYKETKKIIWWCLILGMYFIIIPFIVGTLNAIISFFYNIFILILYLLPSLAISIIIASAGYFILKKIYTTPEK